MDQERETPDTTTEKPEVDSPPIGKTEVNEGNKNEGRGEDAGRGEGEPTE